MFPFGVPFGVPFGAAFFQIQALNSKSAMVQYHALGVLYHIKQKDRIAVSKLVISQMKSASLRSPYATCLLIRYVSKVMETESDNATMYVVLACICDRLPIHLRVLAAGARKRNTAHISRALRPGPRMVTSLAALFVSLFLSPLPPSVQPLAIPSPTLSPPSPPSQPLQPLSLSSLSSLSHDTLTHILSPPTLLTTRPGLRMPACAPLDGAWPPCSELHSLPGEA